MKPTVVYPIQVVFKGTTYGIPADAFPDPHVHFYKSIEEANADLLQHKSISNAEIIKLQPGTEYCADFVESDGPRDLFIQELIRRNPITHSKNFFIRIPHNITLVKTVKWMSAILYEQTANPEFQHVAGQICIYELGPHGNTINMPYVNTIDKDVIKSYSADDILTSHIMAFYRLYKSQDIIEDFILSKDNPIIDKK